MNPMKTIISALGAAVLASCGLFGQTAAPPQTAPNPILAPMPVVEFEVAAVKAVRPSDNTISFGRYGGPGTSDPGRFHRAKATMGDLLREAYGLRWEELIGPSWIVDPQGPNLYLVDAKMPPSTTAEQFRLMLQNLLKERLHLAVHHEIRDFPGYDLVVSAGGPKLKPRGTLSKDPVTILGRDFARYEGRGESMAQLAQRMGVMIADSLGTGDAARPRVRDKTGLTGTFDFRLEYSCADYCGIPPLLRAPLPRVAPQSPEAEAPGQPAHAAAEGPGTRLPDIFGAVKEQLGLKLVKVKPVPVDVIVVDHVDKAPTEN
jgi:uncharacterized protein (TIGR03435 family)